MSSFCHLQLLGTTSNRRPLRYSIYFCQNYIFQYFSNKNKKSFSFDLSLHTSFGSMCNKLKPFVVPESLKNGKKSICKVKLVMVTLFNGDTEGEDHCFSMKNSKVSALSTF